MPDTLGNAIRRYGALCSVVAEVDLAEDTVEVISADQDIMDTSEKIGCLSALLRYPSDHGLIHREDLLDYVRCASTDYLRSCFAGEGGPRDLCLRYRSGVAGDENWYQLEFIPQEGFGPENQKCYMYFRRLSERTLGARLLQEDALRELSENFESIYYVDFDADTVYPYRMSPFIEQQFGATLRMLPGFEQAITSYIGRVVMESDQADMLRICKKEYIAAQLKWRRAFSHNFRVMHHGSELYYQVKFSNVDGAGELHRAIVGFADVTAEMRQRGHRSAMGKKVLAVGEAGGAREELRAIMEKEWVVLTASGSEEALRQLADHPGEVAAVLMDCDATFADDYALIHRIRDLRGGEQIPIIVSATDATVQTCATCLSAGASDFVVYPYHPDLVRNRVRSLVRLSESTATLNLVEKDTLTGLYTREAFYQYAQRIINENPGQDYVIMVSDVEHFKLINEHYGRDMADELLRYLAGTGPGNRAGFILGGRIGEDIFACIKPDVYISREDMQQVIDEVQRRAPVPNVVIKYGACHTVDDRTLSVKQMCDRAIIAMESIKDVYGESYARFDDNLRQKWMMEQLVLEHMEEALVEHQFRVYYQPKHDLETERVSGAEALVRWFHPRLGFINPGVFIPLFEKTGFVRSLDQYIWNEVCRDLRGWLDAGGPEIPISVNISRRDFDSPGLADELVQVADSYALPHRLLHVEVTESAYSDNPKRIAAVLHELRAQGLGVELDDFGTGYSSLTALSSMELDVLKIDMSIIRDDDQPAKRNILEFVLKLAKLLGLKTVQEGVESRQQLERVKALGCDAVQGFYYARPMTRREFLNYIK